MSPSQARADLADATPERQVARLLDAACEFALSGALARARALCASIFLDHTALLLRERTMRQRFVTCLLLLNMSALLSRVLRAVDGVELRVTPLQDPAPLQSLFCFSNGIVLTAPSFGAEIARAERAQRAARWSEVILEAATPTAVAVFPQPLVLNQHVAAVPA